MINEHNEIEAKLAADNVLVSDFCKLMFAQLPSKYECVTGPDTYYRQGDNVIRHREKLNSKTHELTVKRRKSTKSTRDREEIDLHFASNTGVLDVRAFLSATGFEKEFKLVKTAHIFWLKDANYGVELSIVIYDVWRVGEMDRPAITMLDFPRLEERRFIEVEAEKGSEATVAAAKKAVNNWVTYFQEQYKLGDPLNDSLYEIYSGNKYQLVK